MKVIRAVLLGIALAGSAATWAAAQANVDKYRADRLAYEDGYSGGQWDAQHGLRSDWTANHWRDRDNRRAYREGYTRAYREFAVKGNVAPRGYNTYGLEFARKFGYEDGLNDGQRDRSTRHSFRPRHNYNYEDADRGYRSSFENRDEYKRVYREAYAQGYQQGYNAGRLP